MQKPENKAILYGFYIFPHMNRFKDKKYYRVSIKDSDPKKKPLYKFISYTVDDDMIYKMTDDESELESSKSVLPETSSKQNNEDENEIANDMTSNLNSTELPSYRSSAFEDISEYQVIPLDFSEDRVRLNSLANRLIDYFSRDLKGNLDESVHEYEHLNDLESGEPQNKLNIGIEATFSITVKAPFDTVTFKVSTPPTPPKLKDLNNNSSSMNDINLNAASTSQNEPATTSKAATTSPKDIKVINRNVKLEKWMNSIEKLVNKSSIMSLPAEMNLNEMNGVSLGHTSLKLNDKCKETDENILRMRNTLFNLINTILKNIIISPLKLSKFREAMIDILNQVKHKPLEDYASELFQFFNQHIFFGLLESVRVEWSDKFKT